MNDNSYGNWNSMNDAALCQTIGAFVQHHRLKQNKTQDEVARDAGMSRSTLSLLERGEPINIVSLLQVLRALDQLHVMDGFNISEQPSPIALAKIEKQQRQRARGQKNNESPQTDW